MTPHPRIAQHYSDVISLTRGDYNRVDNRLIERIHARLFDQVMVDLNDRLMWNLAHQIREDAS